jgi:hypothetical protein
MRTVEAPISINESRANPASATDPEASAATITTTVPTTFQQRVPYSSASPLRSNGEHRPEQQLAATRNAPIDGHSSIATTLDIYGHLMPGNELTTAVKLEAFLRVTTPPATPIDPNHDGNPCKVASFWNPVSVLENRCAFLRVPRVRIPLPPLFVAPN